MPRSGLDYRAADRNYRRGNRWKILREERRRTGEKRSDLDRLRFFHKYPKIAGIKTGPVKR